MENKTFETYFQKLQACGISEEACLKLREKYGDVLHIASYGIKRDSGLAYEGSMIETSLRKLAVFAIKINELYPERIRVDNKSLVKICLLQHISKSLRLIKQNDNWRAEKLGEIYTYNTGMPAIGTGLQSLSMAVECGIEFTPLEVEAITIIDRNEDDLQAKYYSSMLSSIVRQANEMVHVYTQEVEKVKKQEQRVI